MKKEIQQKLNDRRWESARRLALFALSANPAQYEISLMLHEAYRRLGEITSARDCLENLVSENDDQRFEIGLLLAEDFYLMGSSDHYRLSAEKRMGLSLDEYSDKYSALSIETLDKLSPLSTTSEKQQALAKMQKKCSQSRYVHKPGEIVFDKLAETGNGKIRGTIRHADGTPAAGIEMVLGLEVPIIEEAPGDYLKNSMHYSPEIGEQRARKTLSTADGTYCFADLPDGRHEFIAVCLDPLKYDISTLFLAHNIVVKNGAECVLDLEIKEWSSVVPVPVANPFTDEMEIDGISCRLVHEEVLRNPFHFDFPRQVIHFDLPAGVPADAKYLCLLSSTDSGHALDFQLDGNRLSFFAELPALSDRVYVLYQGKETPFQVSAGAVMQPVIAEDGTTAILSTGRADFRIAWGGDNAATAPIQSVRGEDKCWRGHGRWILPSGVQITGRSNSILSQGPIATTVRLVYDLSTGQKFEIQLTAQQGEAALLVHEISPDLEGAAFEFSLAEFSGGRGFLHWTAENGNMHWTGLTAADRELARLQESVPWWIPPAGFGYAMTADGLEQKDYIAVVSLRRGEWVDRLFERLAYGPGENRELDWPFPEMVGSTVSMITAHTNSRKDAFFRFRCFDGERRWALLVSNFDLNDGIWKEISAVQHKNSSPRLQDFKDWHLDEQDTIKRPSLLVQREKLTELRRKGSAPSSRHLRERVADWKNIANCYDNMGSQGLDAMLDSDPLKLWRLKKEIAGGLPIRSRMTLLGRDYSDMYSPVGGRKITPTAEVYDLIAATGVFTPEEERSTRSGLMLMGHLYMECDLMNWRFNSRNANFEADRVDVVGGIGMVFHGNPDSKLMINHCVALMKSSLEVYCTPGSGKWYENPACYYLHAASCRLNLAFHLWQHGIFDCTTIPRLKDFLSWAINIATAPFIHDNKVLTEGTDAESYASLPKVRRVPPIGDHAHLGQWFSEYFALMAKVYRKSDPVFADRLTWLYQAGGSNGGHFSRHALYFAVMEEEDMLAAPPVELASRRLEGFGSVFRGQFGQPDEFYLLFKLGPGGYRYHNTEGSILLISDGKPLIFDGGEAGETWRHTTLSFGETHMPLAPGHIERFHSFDCVDFSQGINPRALLPGEPTFLSDSCEHELVELAYRRFNEPNPANSRSVLWVKNEYIILHDQLNLAEDRLTHWHLQAVADSHIGDWREGYCFQGRFGTNLQVILPGQEFDAEKITQQPILEYYLQPEETFSMRHLQLSAVSPNQTLAVIRPLAAGGNPVEATLIKEDQKVQGVRVTAEGIEDMHWFNRHGLEYSGNGISFKGRYGSVLRRGETSHLIIEDGTYLATAGLTVRSDGPALCLTVNGTNISLQAQGIGKVDVICQDKTLSFKLTGDAVEVKDLQLI